MTSSTTGMGPPDAPRIRLGRRRVSSRTPPASRELPSAVCQLGDFECEIMALKDAVAEGVKLEDRDGRVADKRSMAGAIVVDSEPYVVMLRHGRIKTDHKPVDGFKARPSACLTDRELQIANLVADGKVNKQIAYQLKISEWTVSTHLRRIFVKYGVNSRANMVKRLLSGEREP